MKGKGAGLRCGRRHARWAAMNTRMFGKTGRTVGEIGLGTWQLGANWGDVTDATARATLRAAYEAGTTFFDTADVYGMGRSETFIGEFLRELGPARSSGVYVATKLGRFSPPGWPENFSRAGVRLHTEASLKRLGVERIDLTQLHCVPGEVMARGEIFESLRELQREGKIGAFGASVESMDEAAICLRQPDLAALQIIFNIFRQKPIHTLFAAAKRQNVALIVRLPLASGLLGGKMTAATTFAAGVALADALKPLVPAGLTLPELALRWCLDFDAVSVLIPGAKNPEQALANTRAAARPALSPELHAKLAEFYDREVAAHIRGPY
jgi:aryl-alcohol dehydrogenase-like predicted oxidoreductase